MIATRAINQLIGGMLDSPSPCMKAFWVTMGLIRLVINRQSSFVKWLFQFLVHVPIVVPNVLNFSRYNLVYQFTFALHLYVHTKHNGNIVKWIHYVCFWNRIPLRCQDWEPHVKMATWISISWSQIIHVFFWRLTVFGSRNVCVETCFFDLDGYQPGVYPLHCWLVN